MNILLLTHQNELSRKTNTGKLVAETLGNKAKVIPWERAKADADLLECIQQGKVGLLYPREDSLALNEACAYDSYIVLDGTWQEAQKMYNKSPYLRSLPTLKIETDRQSRYTLRRNQKQNGLCTAEIVAEVLKEKACLDLADILESKLADFLA